MSVASAPPSLWDFVTAARTKTKSYQFCQASQYYLMASQQDPEVIRKRDGSQVQWDWYCCHEAFTELSHQRQSIFKGGETEKCFTWCNTHLQKRPFWIQKKLGKLGWNSCLGIRKQTGALNTEATVYTGSHSVHHFSRLSWLNNLYFVSCMKGQLDMTMAHDAPSNSETITFSFESNDRVGQVQVRTFSFLD